MHKCYNTQTVEWKYNNLEEKTKSCSDGNEIKQ